MTSYRKWIAAVRRMKDSLPSHYIIAKITHKNEIETSLKSFKTVCQNVKYRMCTRCYFRPWRHVGKFLPTQSLLTLPGSQYGGNSREDDVWRLAVISKLRRFSTRMNASFETNRILYRISNEMRSQDLQNIKHLCHGQIPLGELEKSMTASALFQIMLQKRLISPQDLSPLERLLNQIGRADLAGKIQASGRDTTMQTESALSSNPVDRNYRAFLMKLSDELTRDNVESLKFVADLPGKYLVLFLFQQTVN